MGLRRATVTLAALVGLTLSAWLAAGPQVRQVDEAALKNAGRTGDEWLTSRIDMPTPGSARRSR